MRYVIEGATYDRLEAKCNRYREALERIAETPFSPEPGWRHWRLIAATALREVDAPAETAE